jgi:hypothetical protein
MSMDSREVVRIRTRFAVGFVEVEPTPLSTSLRAMPRAYADNSALWGPLGRLGCSHFLVSPFSHHSRNFPECLVSRVSSLPRDQIPVEAADRNPRAFAFDS